MKWPLAPFAVLLLMQTIALAPLSRANAPLGFLTALLISITIVATLITRSREGGQPRVSGYLQPKLLIPLFVLTACSALAQILRPDLTATSLIVEISAWAPSYLAFARATATDRRYLETFIIALGVAIAGIATIVGTTGNVPLHIYFFSTGEHAKHGIAHLTQERLVMPGTWTIVPLAFVLTIQRIAMFERKGKIGFFALIVGVLLIEAGIIFSYTRNILVSQVITVFVLALVAPMALPRATRRNLTTLLILSAILCAIGVVALPHVIDKWTDRSTGSKSGQTFNLRQRATEVLWQIDTEDFRLVTSPDADKELAHSIGDPLFVLDAWYKFGFIGMLAFLFLIAISLTQALANIKVALRTHGRRGSGAIMLIPLWLLVFAVFLSGMSFTTLQCFLVVWLVLQSANSNLRDGEPLTSQGCPVKDPHLTGRVGAFAG